MPLRFDGAPTGFCTPLKADDGIFTARQEDADHLSMQGAVVAILKSAPATGFLRVRKWCMAGDLIQPESGDTSRSFITD